MEEQRSELRAISSREIRGGATAPTKNKKQVEKVDMKRVLALFRPHRKRIAGVALLIAASAVLGLAQPFLIRDIVDEALPKRDTSLLAWLVLGMVGAAVIGAGLDVYQTLLSNTIGQSVMHELRTKVYGHLQKLSLAFFTRTRTGEVQSRISNDIGGMQSVVTSTVTSLVSAFTTVIATFVAMLVLDWRLTLASLIVVPLFVWLARTVGNMRKQLVGKRQRKLADMSTLVEESLSVSGIVLARTLGRSDDLVARFDKSSGGVADLQVQSAMAGRWRMATVQIAFAAMPALTYMLAGWSNSSSAGFISIGTVVAFTTLQTRLLFPMLTVLRQSVEIQSSMALFSRVFEYLDEKIDVPEPAQPAKVDFAAAKGRVELKGVNFSYDSRAAQTLKNINLEVPSGTTTAIVGATGSGKTTLGYLIARMYDTDSGTVTIDGVNVRDMHSNDRSALVGVVAQETYLIHASVAENLRFAKPDATDEELERAARGAQIHELIASLPDGYDTVVGERGYRFSGGEKQRLAIARVMLQDPSILILDEATSALDTRTEANVQEALSQLSEGRTTIAIAHRLSTVRDANEIVVLNAGEIVERGSHEQLAAAGGAYAALLARDAQERELEETAA